MPLCESKNGQFWSILGLIEQFENKKQCNKHPFLVGLFYGNTKPRYASKFLMKFVEEANTLISEGINISGKVCRFKISSFICDAPAQAFLKGCISHNAYFGCDKCAQKGLHVGRVTFPDRNAELLYF
ncbi:uncharacterized protein LOC136072301 [Hydra vulgaris]|uniref:uncharacterized protein LOC136072301 n=1 Tax=Hydra vulgaris TaxID=6087 RepID=UPI0032E9C281